jgi:hypothetical protein
MMGMNMRESAATRKRASTGEANRNRADQLRRHLLAKHYAEPVTARLICYELGWCESYAAAAMKILVEKGDVEETVFLDISSNHSVKRRLIVMRDKK